MTAKTYYSDTQPNDQQPGWQDWVRVALIGSSRAELPPHLRDALIAQEICSTEESEPEQILLAAGSQQLLQRVAKAALFFLPPLPAAAPALAAAKVSPASSRLLDAIISGEYFDALQEYLLLVVKHQQSLPPERIPDLLALQLRSEFTQQLLERAIGDRGRWLLVQQQTSRQRTLSPLAAIAAHWRSLRAAQPANARQLLADQWPSMPLAERNAALTAMETRLSMDDESWLESCLDDTRKEVRITAAALLLQLPKSQLCIRMFDRLTPCLQLSSKNAWQLVLPTPLPKESERDGVYPTGSKLPGGLPFSWFEQQLACIPPALWEQHFSGLTAVQLLDGAILHAQAERICRALIIATTRYNDQSWTKALLSRFIHEKLPVHIPDKPLAALLEKAPLEIFEQLCCQWLTASAEEGIIAANHPVCHWLLNSPHPWPVTLAGLFWKGFVRMTASAGTRAWYYGHYKSLLIRCSYHAPVQMFEVYKRDWQLATGGFGAWNADVQQLLQVLTFRREMHALLTVDRQL